MAREVPYGDLGNMWQEVLRFVGAISPSISAMLENLIQEPTASLSPGFNILILFGIGAFATSLIQSIGKKYEHGRILWHIFGIGMASYVVVFWATYISAMAGFVAEILIMIFIAIAFSIIKSKFKNWYGPYTKLIYLAGLIVTVFPITAMLPLEKSDLVVSPSRTFVNLPSAGMIEEINVSVTSFKANSYGIQVMAETENNDQLALYLDGRKNGPIEIPSLKRGQTYSSVLKIETSPQIPSGVYGIILNATYSDTFGKTYLRSSKVSVRVGEAKTVSAYHRPSLAYSPVALFFIVGMWLFLTRKI